MRTAAAVLLALLPFAATAQTPARGLKDAPERGALRAVRIAVLGTEDGLGAIAGEPPLARDALGRYWVAAAPMSAAIIVFDSAGQPLRRIGRRGSGPGEFQAIWRILPAGAGVRVYDTGTLRETVLDADGRVAGTRPLPFRPLGIAVWPAGAVVLNASVRTPELVGVPFHRLDRTGRVVSSFGETGSVYRQDAPYAGWLEVAPSEDGTFWAAPKTRYALQHWDTTGRHLLTLERDVDWFRPHLRSPTSDLSREPPPLLMDIATDADGRLWVLLAVAAGGWQSAVEVDRRHPDGERRVVRDMNAFYDAVVEVIDPARSAVVASGRAPVFLLSPR